MIDLHCHVIPGIDDGPRTIAESLALCAAARAAGTETLVATPHVNWDYPHVDAVAIHTAVAHLNSVLGRDGTDIRVRPGAEVNLARIPQLSDAEVGVLRLGAGPYVLVECPYRGGAAIWIQSALREFAERGHRIVLAHPERSPSFRKQAWLLPELIADGMLCCITARSLTGDFGPTAQAYAWGLLEQRLVHVIATDAHDVVRRPPDLGPILAAAGLDAGQIEYFTVAAPQAILAGDALPAPPAVSAPSRRRPPRRSRPHRWLPAGR